LLLFAAVPASLDAGTIALNFEGFPDSTVLAAQYPGLAFSNAIILTAGITLNEFEFPPHSGSNVASDNGGPMTISFASPVQNFSGYFTYAEPLIVRAVNGANSQVAVATSRFSSNEALSGNAGSSPNELLQVSSTGGIASITITGDPAGDSFALDDATVTGPPSPPTVPTLRTLTLVLLGIMIAGLGALTLNRKASTMSRVHRGIAFLAVVLLPLGFVALRLSADPQLPVRQQGSSNGVAIRSLSATPASIQAHTATRVLVTARISHAALIPGSVNLVRRSPDGPPTIIGHLHDDGKEGDAVAGDGLYSTQIALNESATGQIQLQVSVAIRGKMRRVVSEPFTLVVRTVR
jgi:hypothetical protein